MLRDCWTMSEKAWREAHAPPKKIRIHVSPCHPTLVEFHSTHSSGGFDGETTSIIDNPLSYHCQCILELRWGVGEDD